jgi:hypothetical protein
MKIYISGKISGLSEKEYNDNFYFAHLELYREHSALYKKSKIVNPLGIRPLFGIKKWLFFMITDLIALKNCSHIALQSNWEDSKGAFIEHFFSKYVFKHKIIKLKTPE